MRSPLARFAKRSVRAGGNMASQIFVSVAAAVCVGIVTNAYFEQKAEAPETAVVQASEPPVVGPAAATPMRIIGEVTSTAEGTGQPSRPLRPAADVVRNVAEVPAPVGAEPAAMAASLPPLASQTIADLPVRGIDALQTGEIFPGVPSEDMLAEALREGSSAKPERRRFLGLPLPYFVPSAGDLMQTASAAGERIVEIVDRR